MGTAVVTRLRALRSRLAFAALRLVPTEAQRLLALTAAIGIASGLAAVAFHEAIRATEERLIERVILQRSAWTWIPLALLTPTVGGVLGGFFLSRFFPNARGSGIPQVKVAFAGKSGRPRLRDSIAKFVLSTLQIGTGASLGREGPTVQICAGVADALGRVARVSPQARRKLIPVGAAAAIAAAFNAPIAAVTFTIEEVVGKLDETLLSGVIVAAALSAVIERSILGDSAVFDLPNDYRLADWRSLLLYALLGIVAAFVSIVFCDLLLGLRARFAKLRLVPAWARPGIGGLVTGALAVAVISTMHTTGVTGGGYTTLRAALLGTLGVKVMLVLCAAKLVATCFSYSSGGAGGIFAPVLFIGAMLGGAFGSLDVWLFGHDPKTMGAFALVGMGAVFGGAIRAPMTSVLIIIEMTSGYSLILPLMIANMTAYVIARHYRRATVYEALLHQDGVTLEDRHLVEALERLTLEDLVVRDRPFVSFEPGARAPEIIERTSTRTWQDVFPVLDAQAKVLGVITADELRILAAEPEIRLLVNAADLMRPTVGVRLTDALRKAFQTMRAEGVRELPVLDADGRVIGFIDEGAVADAYLAAAPTDRASRLPTPPPST
jgi:CIC family chloride channel protein